MEGFRKKKDHDESHVSSPLRRKSNHHSRRPVEDFPLNDDDAELQRRRQSELLQSPSTSNLERRSSFGLSHVSQLTSDQMREHIDMCIKMNAENKINCKNAFSLNVIDILSYLVHQNTSDLKVASSSLDVSSKIYSLRVDTVYTNVLKMIGVLEKQAGDDEVSTDGLNATQMPNDEDSAQEKRKRPKRKKRNTNLLGTVESLRCTIDRYDKTSLVSTDEDPQTSDMLFLSMAMPRVDENLYIKTMNYPVVEESLTENSDQGSFHKVPSKDVQDLENLDVVSSFKFLNWSLENEEENNIPMEVDTADEDQNDFRFELDDDLPDALPFPASQEIEANTMRGNTVLNRCNRLSAVQENLVDFHELIRSSILNKDLEYSYVAEKDIIHWSAPSHWKINRRPNITPENEKREAAVKRSKKKEIILGYERDDSDVDAIFELGQRSKFSEKRLGSWSEEDVHQFYINPDCDPSLLFRLFQKNTNPKNKRTMTIENENERVSNAQDQEEEPGFDPVMNTIDFHERDDVDQNMNEETDNNAGIDVSVAAHGPLTGENLVTAPDYVQEINLPYSKRAKKIDIRQFKKAMWGIIVNETNRNNNETSFKEIYKQLPNFLSQSNAAAMSRPIAFVSLLHLANEKILALPRVPNYTDVIVKRDKLH